MLKQIFSELMQINFDAVNRSSYFSDPLLVVSMTIGESLAIVSKRRVLLVGISHNKGKITP